MCGFWGHPRWSNQLVLEQHAAAFATGYLQPIAGAVAELWGRGPTPTPVWASPYAVANLTRWRGSLGGGNRWLTPQAWGSTLDAVLAGAPGLAMLAPQDSMGALGNSLANVSALLGATVAASNRHGRQTWSNVELFATLPAGCDSRTTKCGRQPAPFDRIRAQMENEARVLEANGAAGARLIAWEWLGNMSPHLPPGNPAAAAAKANYDAYAAWQHGRGHGQALDG